MNGRDLVKYPRLQELARAELCGARIARLQLVSECLLQQCGVEGVREQEEKTVVGGMVRDSCVVIRVKGFRALHGSHYVRLLESTLLRALEHDVEEHLDEDQDLIGVARNPYSNSHILHRFKGVLDLSKLTFVTDSLCDCFF